MTDQADKGLAKNRRALLIQAIEETLGDGASQAQMLGTPIVSFAAGQATKRHSIINAIGKNASTGIPIFELRGIARAKAVMAVVGGGAKSVGGAGIDGGLKNLHNNAIAAELVVYGISGALTVGRIAMRYKRLVELARIDDVRVGEHCHEGYPGSGSEPNSV